MAMERLGQTISELLAGLRRIEKPKWKTVDDEPGNGHFQIVTDTGTSITFRRVPTIDFQIDEYVQAQLASGAPVVAYRHGEKGVCIVRVNPSIKVTKMTRFLPSPYEPSFRECLEPSAVRPDNYSDPQYVCGGSAEAAPRIEIKGETTAGQPLAATVSFVPSERSQ